MTKEEREERILSLTATVKAIAASINAPVSLDDLEQAGWIGAIQAVDRFNPDHKASLQTFARYRIRGAILDSLRKLDDLPRRTRKLIKQIEATKISFQAVPWPSNGNGEPTDFGYQDSFDERLADADEIQKITPIALACLNERHRLIVNLYYFQGLSMREIGRRLRRHESGISQMLDTAKKRMSEAINDAKLL